MRPRQRSSFAAACAAAALASMLAGCTGDLRVVDADGGSSVPVDASTSPTDAGDVDGGGVVVDASAIPVDGGSMGVDSGSMGVDSGTSLVDAGSPPLSGHVDPMCTDGRYRETAPPNPTASLAGLTFTGDIPALVDAALGLRYGFGLEQVRGGRMHVGFGDCSVLFAGSPTTATQLYRSLDTIVHECGHLNDGRLSSGASNAYVIQPASSLTCMQGDSTSRGGQTFARSRINTDAFAALRPACTTGTRGCDFYRNVYLDGDPDNATFEGGDQGMNMLLEEAVQYVNSLATSYAFGDQIAGSTSARDGILTMLWYVERYLHHARTVYPAAYTFISGNACWRDLILTIWGRAWYYLEVTRGMARFGIDDAAIEALVDDPVLLDEIARIRAASSCAGP